MSSVQRRLRKALGAVKDQTSIGLARVASNIGSPDLEVAILKATTHEAVPTDEKYVHEILFLVCNSPGSVRALATGLAKRFHRTRCWTVALKGLTLIHRLLRGGDRNFEDELRESRSRGLLNLELANFRGGAANSGRGGCRFAAFLRAYARFLEERMEWSITPAGKLESAEGYGLPGREVPGSNPGRREDRGEDFGSNPAKSAEVKLLEMVLVRLPKSQALLDRVVGCRPEGAARSHGLVRMALNFVVRESFQVYSNVCEGVASLIDGFFDMEYRHCGLALEIYRKAAAQSHQLCGYFEACRDMGVCGSFEYPPVERICREHVDTLEEFMKNRFESRSEGRIPGSFGCALGEFDPRPAECVDSAVGYEKKGGSVFPPKCAGSGVRSEGGDSAFASGSGRTEQRNGASGLQRPGSRREENSDLVRIGEPSVEERENGLELALFRGSSQAKVSTEWESFSLSSDRLVSAAVSGKDGWVFDASSGRQTCHSIAGMGGWNVDTNTNSDRQTGSQPIPGKSGWNSSTNSEQRALQPIPGKCTWNLSTNSDQQTCQPSSGKRDWNPNPCSAQESCSSISGKGCQSVDANSDQQAFKLASKPNSDPESRKSVSGKGCWSFDANSDHRAFNLASNPSSDRESCKSVSGKGSFDANSELKAFELASNPGSDQEGCKSISGRGCWGFIANSDQQAFELAAPSGKPGWELALVSMSCPAKSDSSAGRLDDLLLNSLYDHAEQGARKFPSDIPAEDPFAASANIPPPAYVQMDEMKRKQSNLVQEQQLWQRYQSEGMHGYCGLAQLYNGPSCGPGSSISNGPSLVSYGPMPGSTMLTHYNMSGFAFY